MRGPAHSMQVALFCPVPFIRIMHAFRSFFRHSLILLFMLCSVQGVWGWTSGNWSVSPAQAKLPPGTPVTAQFQLHFDSWATGITFPSADTLILSTGLASPHWTVSKTDIVEDQPPITREMDITQGSQLRLNGWTLGYTRKQFNLDVQLTGKAPALDQSQSIRIVQVQEMTADAKPISASTVKKEAFVNVPAPEQTTPAEVAVPDTTMVMTMEPVAAVLAGTQLQKQTYSPGPDPLLVCGMLGVCAYMCAMAKRKD
jgi:hypothetical protein